MSRDILKILEEIRMTMPCSWKVTDLPPDMPHHRTVTFDATTYNNFQLGYELLLEIVSDLTGLEREHLDVVGLHHVYMKIKQKKDEESRKEAMSSAYNKEIQEDRG